MQLSKFIAHAGVCARRKAPALILAGKIKVNNIPLTQVHYQVLPTDQVTYQDKVLKEEEKIYILINKPRGYITTLQDERGRRTVRELINYQGSERMYPVGRLDRHTTGLLLFTNHGDLANRLAHPSSRIQKIYHVTLSMPIRLTDLQHLKNGLHLEDGFIQADAVQVINNKKTRLAITLHSGKNRIIRRIFVHLDYTITRLDRMSYAGLTKQKLPVGSSRLLMHHEVRQLKDLVNLKHH